ncbi:MAG: NADPH-dependent oxidoreductase [Chitinophagaceae bacterium]|nr:MAG: NADPH-dependent oxidoreductase [Chitinophagaceae bacterium]
MIRKYTGETIRPAKDKMITIISGTDRKNSITRDVVLEYHRILRERGENTKVLLLDEVDMTHRDGFFEEVEKEVLIPAEKFIIISPEYNGSYPGILKLMIDHSDVKKVWWHKPVLLTGVSTGRAGNLRGMDHLTGSLLHMKMRVHHNRLPISSVDKLMKDGMFTDAKTVEVIGQQLDEFLLK